MHVQIKKEKEKQGEKNGPPPIRANHETACKPNKLYGPVTLLSSGIAADIASKPVQTHSGQQSWLRMNGLMRSECHPL